MVGIDDKKIFKVALFTAICGLVGMIASANSITPQTVQIKDMDRGMLDKEVSIEGIVTGVSQSQKGETYFLEVMDGTGRIKVVVFESAATEIQKTSVNLESLTQRRIKIVGKVTEYKGSLELVLKDASSLKIMA